MNTESTTRKTFVLVIEAEAEHASIVEAVLSTVRSGLASALVNGEPDYAYNWEGPYVVDQLPRTHSSRTYKPRQLCPDGDLGGKAEAKLAVSFGM